MSTEADLQAVLALPVKERAALARELLQHLHDMDLDAEAAWLDEIKRRAQEVEDGAAQLMDWNVVYARPVDALATLP